MIALPVEPHVRYAATVAVSEHDRDFLRRLGGFQEEGHRAAVAAHQARSPAERLRWSIELMLRHLPSARARLDDPSPFYARARRLGLYQP